MIRFLFALFVLSVPSVVLADTTPQGIPCVFTEGQAWWMTTPGKSGTQFGHLHDGACMPYGQKVSGVLQLIVKIQLHDNPSTFQYFNPVLKTDSQELSLPHNTVLAGATCQNPGTCAWEVPTEVDTRLSNYDGLQEIRIRSYAKTPDGNIMHASVNTIVDIRNGKPVNNIDRMPYARGKGWYTNSGYCEGDVITALPVVPVASWSPVVKVLNHSDSLVVSRHTVLLDADFHNGIPGTVLNSGPGQLQPTSFNLSGLSSGRHKLAVRAECDDPRGSTNSGFLVVAFDVQ